MLLASCEYRVIRDPNIVVRTMASDPPTLNPLLATDVGSRVVNGMVVETLLRQSPKTREYEGVLAERWEPAPDHLQYTFYLRRGVQWHDGEAFTADDIVYSFERINDPKVGAGHIQQQFGDAGISRIEKIDDYTVRFLLDRPYFLALASIGEMPILPQHIFDDGTDMRKHPQNRHSIGTGPMRFVEWKTGQIIRLERNPDYWGKPTQYAGMVFKIIPDSHVSFQALKKGQIDMAGISSIAWARQTGSKKFNRRFHKYRYMSADSGYFYIGWNATHPILGDKRVRHALTMLTPRAQFRENLFYGQAEVATGPFSPSSKQTNPAIQPITYNPTLAVALLDQAGVVDSDGDGIRDRNGQAFRITILYPGSSRVMSAITNVLRENLSKVGIELNVRTMEWSVFIKTIHERNYEAFISGWTGSYEADPYQIWHSSQRENGSNYVDFNNVEVDQLLEAARVEFDEAKRNAMYHRVHAILHEEQPYTFLFNFYARVAVHHRFTNVQVYPGGIDFREWGVGSSEVLVQ